jgi:hypothetical protein
VVYFGVQLVLIGGVLLLAAFLLLQAWQSAKRPGLRLLPVAILRRSQIGTAVRLSAGLLTQAPSRAPPAQRSGRVRSGPIDMEFREDPLIPVEQSARRR